ncbi:MAG: sugar MFS transporter [Bacteroidota bacterium]|nr:sugar MFS transporter [Bacteroidota bacterium]
MNEISKQNNKGYFTSIIIIGILFFIFGFVTWLNGTLIPFLKISCELNNLEAYFVTFAFYISYFVMAIPSSVVLRKTGFKNGMALGLIVMAIGTLAFIPAARFRTYILFLIGLFIQGTGLALLQTASNPYITILGPIESAAKRISIMGICNKVAGVISPLILGSIVLKNVDPIKKHLADIKNVVEKTALLNEMAARVIAPYIIMTVVLILLAVMIRFSSLPDLDSDKNEVNDNKSGKAVSGILQYPHLILGFIALFLYVGVEVIAGDTIILYGMSQKIPINEARIFTSYTLIAMVIGYISGIFTIPKIIKQERALSISAFLGIVFTLAALSSRGFTSVLFIAFLGFANAMVWPAIWPLALSGLGKYIKTGSAILIMGIAGGATLPLIYGRLADISYIGPNQAYWILIPCYIFILYYSLKGYKAGKNNIFSGYE